MILGREIGHRGEYGVKEDPVSISQQNRAATPHHPISKWAMLVEIYGDKLMSEDQTTCQNREGGRARDSSAKENRQSQTGTLSPWGPP